MRRIPTGTRGVRHRLPVGVVAACLGAFVGGRTATPQVPVDTGQVLAGIVVPREDSPSLAYHARTTCVLNQVAAGALRLGGTEAAISFALCAANGALWFVGIAWLVLGIGRHAGAALVAPPVVAALGPFTGLGPCYPIYLTGTPNTYGVFAPGWLLLCVAAYVVGLRRTAALLAGFAPAVHATIGAVLIGACATAGAVGRRGRSFVSTAWPCFAAGLLGTVAVFVAQSLVVPPVMVEAISDAPELKTAMTTYWDNHRTPLIPAAVQLAVVPLTTVLAATALALTRDRRRLAPRARTASLFLAVLWIGGLLGLALHPFVRDLPDLLAAAIPGRYVNLALSTGLPFALGLLARRFRQPWLALGVLGSGIALPWIFPNLLGSTLWIGVLVAFVVDLALVPFDRRRGGAFLRDVRWGGPVSWAACAYLAWDVGRTQALTGPGLLAAGLAGIGVASASGSLSRRFAASRAARACGALLLVGGLVLSGRQVCAEWERFSSNYRDYRNDPFWAAVHARRGPYLPFFDDDAARYAARAPVVDAIPMTAYLYAPGALPRFARLVHGAYGVDLLRPPFAPQDFRTNQSQAKAFAARTWSGRTPGEWHAVGAELGVRDVLAPAGIELQLPVVARSGTYVLYEIPESNP